MRIKIFAHPNCQIVENAVNEWLEENEMYIEITAFTYHDYGSHYSILIKYNKKIVR